MFPCVYPACFAQKISMHPSGGSKHAWKWIRRGLFMTCRALCDPTISFFVFVGACKNLLSLSHASPAYALVCFSALGNALRTPSALIRLAVLYVMIFVLQFAWKTVLQAGVSTLMSWTVPVMSSTYHSAVTGLHVGTTSIVEAHRGARAVYRVTQSISHAFNHPQGFLQMLTVPVSQRLFFALEKILNLQKAYITYLGTLFRALQRLVDAYSSGIWSHSRRRVVQFLRQGMQYLWAKSDIMFGTVLRQLRTSPHYKRDHRIAQRIGLQSLQLGEWTNESTIVPNARHIYSSSRAISTEVVNHEKLLDQAFREARVEVQKVLAADHVGGRWP